MTYSELNFLSENNLAEPGKKSINSELHVLSEGHLLEQFNKLVRTERKITHLILQHIAEIERRRLYLSKAYSSLFDYLTKGCGYSPGAAMRRIDGARLLKEIPEMAEKIESGKIQLSQVSQLQRAVREVKKLEQRIVSLDEKRDILLQIEQTSQRESEKIIAESLALPLPIPSKTIVHRDHSVTLTITLTKQQQEILEDVKASISHSVPTVGWTEVFVHLAERELRRRFGKKLGEGLGKNLGKKQNSAQSANSHSAIANRAKKSLDSEVAIAQPLSLVTELTSPAVALEHQAIESAKRRGEKVEKTETFAKVPSDQVVASKHLNPVGQRRRAIAAPIRKSVLNRQASCQFRDPSTGRKCDSRSFLQIDHVKAVSAGGGNARENLQVLCAVHNRWKFREDSAP